MTQDRRHLSQLVVGLAIIAVGVLFTLDNIGMIDASEFIRYWPALLIVYGITKIFSGCSYSDRTWGAIVGIVGVTLLLNKLGIWYVNVWHLWPLILVFIGAKVLWNSYLRQNRETPVTRSQSPEEADSYVNLTAIMSGYERANGSPDFRGGDAMAVMGGIELDLRKAAIKEGDAVLEVFAFWGGISIRVPENWVIVNEATPIMGGIEDKSYRQSTEHAKRMIIRGSIIMGGVEIKN